MSDAEISVVNICLTRCFAVADKIWSSCESEFLGCRRIKIGCVLSEAVAWHTKEFPIVVLIYSLRVGEEIMIRLT